MVYEVKGKTAQTPAIGDLAPMYDFSANAPAVFSPNALLNNVNGKNKIINGSFDIWQAGVSYSYSANSHGPDCWRNVFDGAGSTKSMALTGYTGPLDAAMPTRYYCTTVCSVAGAGETFNYFLQPIEGANTLHNGSVTLSYWLYSSNAYTATINLVQNFGTGGSPSASVTVTTTQAIAIGWNKVIKTFTLADAILGKTYGTNNDSTLRVEIGLPLNQTYTCAVSNVQLEYGTEATKFEIETVADTLRKCQRYFNKSFPVSLAPASAVGASYNGNCYTGQITLAGAVSNRFASQFFPIVMRAAPTITFYNPINANSQAYDTTAGADCSSTTASSVGERGFFVNAVGAAGSAVGNRILLHYIADARLT
jgi:hypothetical protein